MAIHPLNVSCPQVDLDALQDSMLFPFAVEFGEMPKVTFSKRMELNRPLSHPDVIKYRYSGGICPPYQVKATLLSHRRVSLVLCAAVY